MKAPALPVPAKNNIENYLEAAVRANTKRSYDAAVSHFEINWGGFLPATPETIAKYLADHGGVLSINTLKLRLAGLAKWHIDQGFPDPTKTPLVRQVFKGIQAVHPAIERQARPLHLAQLERVIEHLERLIVLAQNSEDSNDALRHTRDKAFLLMGFWRGFRGDELRKLKIEHVNVVGERWLECYLPQSKGDRQLQGVHFKIPALARLCPVSAYSNWILLAQLREGPIFRKIDRWGTVSQNGLSKNSVGPLLRKVFGQAGLEMAAEFSGHSLRRGFAMWANDNGWDLKTLMNYVGWKDVNSAMRYIDGNDPFAGHRKVEAIDNDALNTYSKGPESTVKPMLAIDTALP